MKRIVQFILSTALMMSVAGCANSSKTYNIKFVNEDETVLQEMTVKRGVVPEYTGETPKKIHNMEYTYSFSGWTPQVVAAKADATYTATYESVKRKYTITFNNLDGTLLSSSLVEYGTMPTPPSSPTYGPSAKYDYSFKGWDKEITKVNGDETYTATYNKTIHSFLVTFLDEDETTVLKSERFDYGQTPTCADPSKPSTVSKVYEFAGWSPVVEPVYKDATYIAHYNESVRKYTITFLDEDETTVLKAAQMEYGEMPTCDNPKKPSTETNSFIFQGWSPEVVAVVSDATYVATYEIVARLYEIIFQDNDGNIMDIQYLNSGVSPVVPDTNKPDDEEFSYTFVSWDKTIVPATADVTYTATYTKERIGYYFNKDKLETYVGAALFDVTDNKDVTSAMGENDGGSLIGTAGRYLQYKAADAHTYKISLPKIDFRNFKSLSSTVRFMCYQNDVTIAFTKALAQSKAGICVTESKLEGRIEVVTTGTNTVVVQLNINPDSSVKISKTFNNSDIYKGNKSIELYMYNTGGTKYFTIGEFAPRKDKQYQINKDRILGVNDTYSWAACYIQTVVGYTFLPTSDSAGRFGFNDPDTVKLFRNGELVSNSLITGTTAANAFILSDHYFSIGGGGSASDFNWMSRMFSSDPTSPIGVFQDNDIIVINGVLVGVVSATEGYEINVDLTFRINFVENGYQGTSTGLQFTLL